MFSRFYGNSGGESRRRYNELKEKQKLLVWRNVVDEGAAGMLTQSVAREYHQGESHFNTRKGRSPSENHRISAGHTDAISR
jgi:hypothetical protein